MTKAKSQQNYTRYASTSILKHEKGHLKVHPSLKNCAMGKKSQQKGCSMLGTKPYIMLDRNVSNDNHPSKKKSKQIIWFHYYTK